MIDQTPYPVILVAAAVDVAFIAWWYVRDEPLVDWLALNELRAFDLDGGDVDGE